MISVSGGLRDVIVCVAAKKTNYGRQLMQRALITTIGFDGLVHEHEMIVAKNYNLRPLNKLELWLLTPHIERERQRRRQQARLDVARRSFWI